MPWEVLVVPAELAVVRVEGGVEVAAVFQGHLGSRGGS